MDDPGSDNHDAGPSGNGATPDRTEVTAWERAMMARVAAGDDSALDRIFDQYASLVFGIAKRLVGADHAADVTQEVFVGLWNRPEQFDASRGSLRTFLATAARRRGIDALRSRNRAADREAKVAHRAVATVPSVDEAVVAMVTSARVRSAVRSLPDEQRRAIELAYFDGLTFREVAVVTGVAEGTAKSRLRLALGRLASMLASEGQLETV